MKSRFLAIVLLISATSFGQSNQGSISGVVTDAQGAAVPGVKVTMPNLETGLPHSATTNRAGFYPLPALPPRAHSLTAARHGVRRYCRQGVPLTTGQTPGPRREQEARRGYGK